MEGLRVTIQELVHEVGIRTGSVHSINCAGGEFVKYTPKVLAHQKKHLRKKIEWLSDCGKIRSAKSGKWRAYYISGALFLIRKAWFNISARSGRSSCRNENRRARIIMSMRNNRELTRSTSAKMFHTSFEWEVTPPKDAFSDCLQV